MTKEQIGKLIGIVLAFMLAVLGVFGYHVTVVQPLQEAVAGLQVAPPLVESRGVTGFDDLSVSTVTTSGTGTFAGNLAANGGITVDTSNFTVNGSSGAVSTASTLAVGGVSSFGGDMTLTADTTGGNSGAKNEFIGLPRIKLVGGGQGTNPGSQTIALADDSPEGEYAPIDADVTEAAETGFFKYGSGSYKAVFAATAAAGDGFVDAALGANASWEDMESVGLLLYSNVAIASGNLTLVLTDDGGARTFDIPSLAGNKWEWVEVDISALNAGTGDVISDVAVKLSAAGATALGAFTLYMDIAYVWDAADEESLGVSIIQDGVLGVINTESGAQLAELTDYIVHYQSGVDAIVYVTDQSTADIAVIAAY